MRKFDTCKSYPTVRPGWKLESQIKFFLWLSVSWHLSGIRQSVAGSLLVVSLPCKCQCMICSNNFSLSTELHWHVGLCTTRNDPTGLCLTSDFSFSCLDSGNHKKKLIYNFSLHSTVRLGDCVLNRKLNCWGHLCQSSTPDKEGEVLSLQIRTMSTVVLQLIDLISERKTWLKNRQKQ